MGGVWRELLKQPPSEEKRGSSTPLWCKGCPPLATQLLRKRALFRGTSTFYHTTSVGTDPAYCCPSSSLWRNSSSGNAPWVLAHPLFFMKQIRRERALVLAPSYFFGMEKLRRKRALYRRSSFLFLRTPDGNTPCF